MKISAEFDQLSRLYDKLHDAFQIREITIERKNFDLPVQELKVINAGDVKFNLAINTIVLPTGATNVIFKTVVVYFKNEKGTILADFKIVYTFEIDKDSEYLLENDNSYTIIPFANEFLDHIIIATTRGLMYSELRGTYLDKTILPLTKPSNIKSK